MKVKITASLIVLAVALALVALRGHIVLGQDLQAEQKQGLNVLGNVFANEGQVNLSGTRALVLPYGGGLTVQRIIRGPGHKYRVEFASPDRVAGRLLLSDASNRWLYLPERRLAMATQAADASLIAKRRAEWLSRVPDVFTVRYFGARPFLGRRALVVQLVRRHPPRTYRKFWVDADHWVPLLRQHFAPDGSLLGEERFTEVQFPSEAPPDETFEFQPPPRTRVVSDPQPILRFADPADLAKRLDFRLVLPQSVPDDFFLQDACLLRFRGRPVAWLRYTDILNFLSVFERQRPSGAPAGGLPAIPMVVLRERDPLWIVVLGSMPKPVLERVADSIQP